MSKYHHSISGRKLLFVVLFNFIITITEFFGGLFSHSLSLLSDSFHNLADTVAISMTYIAYKIGKRAPDENRTFGYKRFEIIVAFVNASVMMVIIVFMIYEALKRLKNPVSIKFNIMLIIAIIGLLGNFFSMLFLRNERHDNLNTRAAFLHLLSDFFSSILVITGALLIKFFNISYIDSILTIIIVLLLLKETFLILKESISILLETKPKNIDINNMINKIKEQTVYIENVHHIHLWSINENEILLECHIRLNKNLKIETIDGIKDKINAVLNKEFSIHHSNFQFEYRGCEDEGIIHKV